MAGAEWLLAFGFGEQFAESVEAFFPGRAVVADPGFEVVEAGVVDAAGADPAELFGTCEAGVFQDLQVLADGGQGDTKGLGQAGDGGGGPAEAVEDGAAGGIAEGVKDAVDGGILFLHFPPCFFGPVVAG
jgi:hypothetical protein